ncbi:uncharacterized protein LOC129754678 [Uranotaenia lowii]|uniref:uncharacterized protein LOC129754678 n=1 Tax=Uranotaenia lowii TaxID=190385 RepID=UPI002478F9CB|nr:uncharacterized protein LOC129754678 [Uranotaenia lowii]
MTTHGWQPRFFLLTSMAILITLQQQLGSIECAKAGTSVSQQSPKELRKLSSDLLKELRQAEKALAPFQKQKTTLNQQLRSYSALSTRHAWKSPAMQKQRSQAIRKDALRMRSTLRAFDKNFKSNFDSKLRSLKAKAARQVNPNGGGDLREQLEQSAAIYRKILELLSNLIECPIHILEILGPIGPTTDTSEYVDVTEPVYPGELESPEGNSVY